MARTARIKKESECVANYHLMSRTNNKVFLFNDAHMRDLLVELRSCWGAPEYRVLAERGRPL